MAHGTSRARRGLSGGEWGLLLLFGMLLLTTGLTLLTERRFAVLAPDIDLLINGIAALVAGIAAWLSWLRHRHMADLSAAYQAAAFAIFTVTAAIQTLADLGIGEVELGLSLAEPRQAPIYAWSLLRVLAGALLLRSAWLRLHPPTAYRLAGATVVIVIAAALAVAGGMYVLEPILPPLLGDESFERLGAAGAFGGPLPGITLLELVLQAVGAVLLGSAALAYTVAARRGIAPAGLYLAAGLVLAAFAQLHFALFPGIYSGLVTSSDVLRVLFYAFVVFGIQADAAAALRQLRAANRRLHELREVELANASLAERARLAREVHDGLAQHLWLAKLATDRLEGDALAPEIEQVRAELSALLEAGLEEARQTVVSLRDPADAATPLADMLARQARRFEEQTGLDTRLHLEPTDEVVPPVVAAELLRIAQEALNNVRKHADATMVTLELKPSAAGMRLTVRDNGVGFDTGTERTGYGLDSMAERAASIGGRLAVESSQLAGTVVRVDVPASGPERAPPAGT